MKRIVDGVTYDTSTSDVVGVKEWEDEIERESRCLTLFQTRLGAFFVLDETTRPDRNDPDEWHTCTKVRPLSRAEAQAWMLRGDVEVVDSPFEDPPEAAADVDKASAA